jgi:membrane-bound ClpP family serine protease
MQVTALGAVSAPHRRKISIEAADQRKWAAAMVSLDTPGGLYLSP